MKRFPCLPCSAVARARGGRWRAAAAGLALVAALSASPLHAASCARIALVLSVDSSSSVEDWEFALEKQGLAAALRDREVQATLLGAGPVKVATLFWGDSASGTLTSGWHRLVTPDDAEHLARHIEAVPRTIGGNTSLGAGLGAALELLARPEACAQRGIVNITGDGRETLIPREPARGISLAVARKMAERMGVTVNGLAIANEEPDLGDYYRRHVMLGSGSFVMEVKTLADYAQAIRKKIMRETEVLVSAADRID